MVRHMILVIHMRFWTWRNPTRSGGVIVISLIFESDLMRCQTDMCKLAIVTVPALANS